MKSSRSWPWITVVVVAGTWLSACFPGLVSAFLFDRQAILQGDFWRLWTGHWVHFSAWHLLADTAVLGWAGSMVEWRDRGRWILFLTAAPGVISVGLLALLPHLEVYGGLSGLATGAVVLWVLDLQERSEGWKRAGWGMLALVGLKIGGEILCGGSPFVDLASAGVRSVPLSHALGGGLALLLGWCTRPSILPRLARATRES